MNPSLILVNYRFSLQGKVHLNMEYNFSLYSDNTNRNKMFPTIILNEATCNLYSRLSMSKYVEIGRHAVFFRR